MRRKDRDSRKEHRNNGGSDMNAYEKEHSELVRRIGAECTVLLKNDGGFPLSAPGKLALYGSGARRTVRGGTGSGEVNTRRVTSIEEGLEAAGFIVTTKAWLDAYEDVRIAAKEAFIRELKRKAREHHTLAILENMGAVMPEPDYRLPLDGEGDTAIYVLSRISGEGSDRTALPGDIILTETEKRDIRRLDEKYDNFLLVLNVGGVVDLSPVADVSNILLLSQLGAETGHILADIVLGRSYPAGKLATTWSAWADYPTVGDFGDRDDTRYNEGIYVGYRYFDTVGKPPLFPFGFGLGYTTFEVRTLGASEAAGAVTVRALVRNTGSFAGREVVQAYVSVPQGKLDQPYQTLAAFAKSRELAPGEEETVTLTFDLRDLASYDAETASWILEAGDYVLRVGTSSADTAPAAVLRLAEGAVVRTGRNCLGQPDFEDWKPVVYAVSEVAVGIPVLTVNASSMQKEETIYDVPACIDPQVAKWSDKTLALFGIGAFDPKGGIASVIGNASKSVAGAAGETAGVLKDKGVPVLVMADGPAGLRLSREYVMDEKGKIHSIGGGMPESMMDLMPAPAALAMKAMGRKIPKGELHEQYCTAIPISTAIAQSWDVEAAETCGDLVGDEMVRFGVHLWLAPALNIHRDIRCGRNFEYFSEDPLIAGKMAAAITRGVQKHPGCGTTVKHFAGNNQETNRYNSNSQVSECAMREIYLRGFGIAVRESQPHAVMTSYNLLNGVHTSEHRGLIEDILRAEFGFEGIVMTDWIIGVMYGKKNKYAGPNAARTAAAGGDITMPGGKGDYEQLMKGIGDGTVSRAQLEANATRVVLMARRLAKKN
ncbi:MAG: glycoside hydrolase family 3 C-terminal domain-containing protein [Lachnospiraceae bacterium]|nr:glycoside hydrolase family 3 C-terminal domain-containing protein [Lachnospiraceae bacterium]